MQHIYNAIHTILVLEFGINQVHLQTKLMFTCTFMEQPFSSVRYRVNYIVTGKVKTGNFKIMFRSNCIKVLLYMCEEFFPKVYISTLSANPNCIYSQYNSYSTVISISPKCPTYSTSCTTTVKR